MAKVSYKTEDQVRDGAKITLGFDKTEAKIQQGTGQITTFNQLGFKGFLTNPTAGTSPKILTFPQSFWKRNRNQKMFPFKNGLMSLSRTAISF